MSEPLATVIDKERDRLGKALADLRAKQKELEAQRATLETELDALYTYEAASLTESQSRRVKRLPRL